ncbi:MAG: sensor histidine kinase [Sarcina sp.]
MIFKYNKFGKKLYLMTFIIIIVVFGSTYFLNNFFLSKYYVYESKKNVDSIYNYIKGTSLSEVQKNIDYLEGENNVTILIINSDYNLEGLNGFNENIQLLLNKNKINISKFWLTENDLKEVNEGMYVNKIFYQPKLQSNYFVKIFKDKGEFILIGKSLANNSSTIKIINKFNFYIITIAIFISLFLVWLFTRKTIKSIGDLKNQARNIANLNFNNSYIKTNDEIEELSKDLNIMSEKLKKAHEDLEQKNEDLKLLISSISHEVKTPLALIKAYAIGMKDGLDDGNFLDVIIEQVDTSSELVTNLLELSKIQRAVAKKENFDLIKLLNEIVNSYRIALKNSNLKLIMNFNGLKNGEILADKKQIEIVLNNLISNAIKYNDGNYISINLEKKQEKIKLTIANETNKVMKENLNEIWKPFYVIEQSRSKELTGTGIGLSIVENILKLNNLLYSVELENKVILFNITF